MWRAPRGGSVYVRASTARDTATGERIDPLVLIATATSRRTSLSWARFFDRLSDRRLARTCIRVQARSCGIDSRRGSPAAREER